MQTSIKLIAIIALIGATSAHAYGDRIVIKPVLPGGIPDYTARQTVIEPSRYRSGEYNVRQTLPGGIPDFSAPGYTIRDRGAYTEVRPTLPGGIPDLSSPGYRIERGY